MLHYVGETARRLHSLRRHLLSLVQGTVIQVNDLGVSLGKHTRVFVLIHCLPLAIQLVLFVVLFYRHLVYALSELLSNHNLCVLVPRVQPILIIALPLREDGLLVALLVLEHALERVEV